MQQSIKRMNQTAEELSKELDLPPEAKYQILQMLYESESETSSPTETLRSEKSIEQPQLLVEGASSMSETDIVKGRYRLIRELGRGAFGAVYLAKDTHENDREVAVKMLATRISEPAQQKAFRDEANLIAGWNHPNIVNILDNGIEDETPFIVIGYAPNGTLRQSHPKGTSVPLDEVVSYAEQIGAALQYAHNRRVIHRDIKPENLLLGSDMQVLLSDFGIAAIAPTTTTAAGKLLVEPAGTPLYMAPEQFDGDPSRRSDQYSLAIVIYEWLCGKLPFTGSNLLDLAYQHRSVSPPSLCERAPNIPPSVEQVIMKALAKDRQQRYESIGEFIDALTKAASRQKVGPSRRTLLMFGVASGVFGLGLVTGGAATLGWLNVTQKPVVSSPTQKPVVPFPLKIGGKEDLEAILLKEMYVQLLDNAGFKAISDGLRGKSEWVFGAITTGKIDLYAEFLLTGLQRLGRETMKDRQQDFENVSQGFQQKYQVVWLDQAVNLDDNYCVAMPRSKANQLGITKISQLAQVIQQQSSPFVFAVTPDGKTRAFPSLQEKYRIVFNDDNTLPCDDEKTIFLKVNRLAAQIGVCQATSPWIKIDDFVRLTDDKGAFPVDTPSPIIREWVLDKAPQIKDILKPLAGLLTVEVSTELQAQLVDDETRVKTVVSDWLKSHRLL